MELNSKQKRQRFLYELSDMLTGSAFPIMLQLILSVSIIVFADYSADTALRLIALLGGEILLFGAYVLFGKQNGTVAYRAKMQNKKKRDLNSTDLKVIYRTGEYALYKGFLIGLISVMPYLLIQFIQCLASNIVCEFILKYAFGWAAYPFVVIAEIASLNEINQWLNYVWIVFPVCIHAAAYVWGASVEAKKWQKLEEAGGTGRGK